MLTAGARIPMTPDEEATVDELLREHGEGSFSRRDPGEQGPVVFSGGGLTFEIESDGKKAEVPHG